MLPNTTNYPQALIPHFKADMQQFRDAIAANAKFLNTIVGDIDFLDLVRFRILIAAPPSPFLLNQGLCSFCVCVGACVCRTACALLDGRAMLRSRHQVSYFGLVAKGVLWVNPQCHGLTQLRSALSLVQTWCLQVSSWTKCM